MSVRQTSGSTDVLTPTKEIDMKKLLLTFVGVTGFYAAAAIATPAPAEATDDVWWYYYYSQEQKKDICVDFACGILQFCCWI
jgi:hypothetical protein